MKINNIPFLTLWLIIGVSWMVILDVFTSMHILQIGFLWLIITGILILLTTMIRLEKEVCEDLGLEWSLMGHKMKKKES